MYVNDVVIEKIEKRLKHPGYHCSSLSRGFLPCIRTYTSPFISWYSLVAFQSHIVFNYILTG